MYEAIGQCASAAARFVDSCGVNVMRVCWCGGIARISVLAVKVFSSPPAEADPTTTVTASSLL